MNGQSNGVISFVNTPSHEQRGDNNEIRVFNRRVWTGERWQCVEYVRRYLLQTRGLTFPSIPNAYAIPHLESMMDIRRHTLHPVRWYPRRGSRSPPRAGDVIVFRDGPSGHVGMVHAVMDETEGWLAIADQNDQYGRYWESPSFAYVISRHHPSVLGWLRV